MASVRWFIAYRFLGACLPYLPVASLCLAARGLSWSEVLQLGALYTIASAVLVLPVSAVAQRIGPRRTLIGGALAVSIGAVLAAGAHDVTTMAIAQIAFAIAAAVDAGADSAYLWTLLGHDRDAYRRAEARSTAGKLAGGVVGIGLGAVLLRVSPAAPFAAAAVFALAAAACAARLREVQLPIATTRSVPVAARALAVAAGGPRWLLIGIVSCAVARVRARALGPLLADGGLTAAAATAVATAAAATGAIAAALTGALRGSWQRLALFAGAPAMLAMLAIGLASAHGASAAAIVAALPVLAAVLAPLWRAHLNQHAPANAPRLLVLAVDATVGRIIAAALSLAIASSAPRAGAAILGVGLIAVLVAVAAAVVLRDRRIRFALVAAVALALPQLAGANVATPAPAWTADAPALCTDELTIDKPLGMGSTIKFKARVGTTKVVVRPAQALDAGNFRADVAAHRIATALGVTTVPYGCLRRIDRASLDAVAGTELRRRLADEVSWAADGTVAVSVVAWVDGVKPAGLEQTRRAWRAQLAQVTPLAGDTTAAAEGSRLAVWDFLIANWDRWSGGNTFRIGTLGAFVWLDNAAGFGRELERTRAARARTLSKVERFSRSLIDTLRTLDDPSLDRVLAGTGLTAARITELAARRDLILAHVDALIATYGEAAVLVFD
jgi:hypothetical protein